MTRRHTFIVIVTWLCQTKLLRCICSTSKGTCVLNRLHSFCAIVQFISTTKNNMVMRWTKHRERNGPEQRPFVPRWWVGSCGLRGNAIREGWELGLAGFDDWLETPSKRWGIWVPPPWHLQWLSAGKFWFINGSHIVGDNTIMVLMFTAQKYLHFGECKTDLVSKHSVAEWD
jgi:hypothetical protein